MENNFFVGVIHHKKKLLKPEYTEKLVLYSEDGYNYVDLTNNNLYTIDENELEYVIKETIIPTDVNSYKVDYLYLLSKYKNREVEANTNKRKKLIIINKLSK